MAIRPWCGGLRCGRRHVDPSCASPPRQKAKSSRPQLRRTAMNNATKGGGAKQLPPPIPDFASAHLLWDLDNIRPSTVEQTLVTAHRLQVAVQRAAAPPVQLSAYANTATISRLGRGDPHALGAALQLLPCRLIPTPNRSQSADFAMRTEMYHLIERLRGKCACLVCVSSDQGFAPIMRYAASQGFFTICIGSPPQRGSAWASYYDWGKRYPLCAACHLTLLWSFGPGSQAPLSGQEQELLAWWEQLGVKGGSNSGALAGRDLLGPEGSRQGRQGPQNGSRRSNKTGSTARREAATLAEGLQAGSNAQQFCGSVAGSWINLHLPQPDGAAGPLSV